MADPVGTSEKSLFMWGREGTSDGIAKVILLAGFFDGICAHPGQNILILPKDKLRKEAGERGGVRRC